MWLCGGHVDVLVVHLLYSVGSYICISDRRGIVRDWAITNFLPIEDISRLVLLLHATHSW